VENIKSPEDHVESVLERVEKRYITATYDVADWTSHEDFLEQLAYKSGRLLKVRWSLFAVVTYANIVYYTVLLLAVVDFLHGVHTCTCSASRENGEKLKFVNVIL